MKRLILILTVPLLFAACSSPTPTPSAPTADLSGTETAVTERVLATLTAAAPTQPPPPEPKATVTPPPLPTISLQLSPSVTPVPELPTQVLRRAPTQVPTPAPPQVSREALRGKILFKSTRGGGSYPNSFQYYVMDPDGSNVQRLEMNAAKALYNELKPLEGYSPDRSQVVIGEVACGAPPCSLYIGALEVVQARSQGEWTGSKRKGYTKAVDPAWSPNGDIIVFVANWENDRTNNIFKGTPFQTNPDFRRLTDFGGHRDTRNPTFSPDGALVAFATQDGPRWQIWVLNPNVADYQSSNPHNISNSQAQDWDPLWVK